MRSGVLLKFRAVLFALGFYPVTILFAPFCLLLGPLLSFRQRFVFFTAINYFYIFWLRVTCGLKVEVSGRENLPQEGAFVAVANHQSEWETLYLQLLVRPQAVVLKRELLKIPLFGWALGMLNPIALDRSKPRDALKQLLQQGSERLKDGVPVLIFPQGTRVPVGKMGRFNKGGTMLAVSNQVPIVPIVHDAGRYWPGKSFIKYPGVVKVRIGKPVAVEDRPVDEIHAEVMGWIEQEMVKQESGA
ncbi:lysophospholipid acyltransferase family protein [Nitrincola alkalilacustris]|uniref:lysophospholipid acyltransferase family protein n=1 Tax=Nitrincola alkalilacustris TaxID=1571224 RepID=UPI00124C1BA9|nr:lysophospholipid acyltransferase family protein [Nitrincola alkalilacustris]